MEKNYRQNRLISSKNSKLAREQFRSEKEEIIRNKSFIKKMTTRKIKSNVAKASESSLIQGRIDFAKNRMSSLNEMSEYFQDFITTQKTPIKRADRIIATLLNEKRENAELSI